MKALWIFTACVVACLSVAGCGDDTESPTSVVSKYHQGIIDMDMEAIKAISAPDADLGKIKALLEFRSKALKKNGLPQIVSEKIDGDTAVVRCKFGPMEQDVELKKTDGVWKVK
jgi:hypothetical protein